MFHPPFPTARSWGDFASSVFDLIVPVRVAMKYGGIKKPGRRLRSPTTQEIWPKARCAQSCVKLEWTSIPSCESEEGESGAKPGGGLVAGRTGLGGGRPDRG